MKGKLKAQKKIMDEADALIRKYRH